MARWNPFRRSTGGNGHDDRPSPAAAAAAAERLYEAGQYMPALAAYRDVIEYWHEVRTQRPAEPEPMVQLAEAMRGAGRCLRKLGQFEEAVEVLVTAHLIAGELVAQDRPRWAPLLAAVLEVEASALAETGRWPEALDASRRAVELRPEAGAEHDLAVALRVFAHVRAGAGTDLREALEAVARAMELHLAFAARLPNPAPYQDQLYMTQQVQALVVSRM